MLRILVANSKGGCGKTMLATNLADYYANLGRRTALLDTDRQESSLRWHALRGSQSAPIDVRPYYGAPSGSTWDNDWGVPEDTERLIIDSPAGLRGFPLGNLLRRVDVLIVPVLPSRGDFESSMQFLELVRRRPESRNSVLKIGLVANRMRSNTRSSASLRERLRETGLPLITELRDTQLYVFVDGLGKGVHDLRSARARDAQREWAPLVEWIESPGAGGVIQPAVESP